MSPAEIKLVRLVTARVAKMTPPVARAYLRAINILRDSLGAEELARRIARGVFDVFDDATLNAAFNGYRQELRAAVAEGFRYTAPDINQVPLTFKQPAIFFDVLSPRVRLAITQLEDRIITTAKAEVRETVRQAVAAGLEGGTNPRTVARGLRDVIGLAPKDEKAIRAFRAELQRGDRDALNRALGRGTITLPDGRTTTRAAHAGGFGVNEQDLATLNRTLGNQPLTSAQIDKAVDQYTKRLQALHAETISRTTSLQAYKAGHRASYQAAIDAGYVDPDRAMSSWITVNDTRVRPEHQALNGEVRRFGQSFSNGETEPGESSYNCRCSLLHYEAPRRRTA